VRTLLLLLLLLIAVAMSEEEEADGKDDADWGVDDSLSCCCELLIVADEIDMHDIATSSAAALGMDLVILWKNHSTCR